MREGLESSTWRKKSVEEHQNRLGAIFEGGGGGLRGGEVFLGLEAAGHEAYIRPVRGPGDPAISRDVPGDPGTCACRPDGLGFETVIVFLKYYFY
jgi:hypothetical protein